MRFRDRRDAGQRLAQHLAVMRHEHPLVLALPRGGVPVAAEVAHLLQAPMDVLVVRKIGLPRQPELGVGAVGEGGIRVYNDALLDDLRLIPADVEDVARRETREVHRRVERYRGTHAAAAVRGRTVLLVDDGIATGFTVRAAVEILRRRQAARIVVAVPVGARRSVDELRHVADDVVCLDTPPDFLAIGEFYDDFGQVSDAEVVAILDTFRTPTAVAHHEAPSLDVEMHVDDVVLPGTVAVPTSAAGLVVFAHGSGSSRLSPRNQTVARNLNDAGFATLLFDLLTVPEARDRARVFDLPLLSRRLVAVTRWVQDRPALAGLPIAYFGASTGASAALMAAAELGSEVAVVVSRGGRPDLARGALTRLTAPTLLVVGGDDEVVLDLNRRAARLLRCEHELVVIPGATHLFEEPGALDEVTAATARWLRDHLQPTMARGPTR